MAWRLFSRSATADDMVLDFGSAQLINRQPLKNCNTIESQQQTSGPSDGVTLNTMFTSASIARGDDTIVWSSDDTIARYGLCLPQAMIKVYRPRVPRRLANQSEGYAGTDRQGHLNLGGNDLWMFCVRCALS